MGRPWYSLFRWLSRKRQSKEKENLENCPVFKSPGVTHLVSPPEAMKGYNFLNNSQTLTLYKLIDLQNSHRSESFSRWTRQIPGVMDSLIGLESILLIRRQTSGTTCEEVSRKHSLRREEGPQVGTLPHCLQHGMQSPCV